MPKGYYYVKYYLWFVLITCLTSASPFSTDSIICSVFSLYIYQTVVYSYNGLVAVDKFKNIKNSESKRKAI